nr:melanoma inhibitory activity protein 2 isoform X4 [Chrysemys picta bellii]
MAKFLDHRVLLLVISFLTSLQSTKLMSEWKKCGDQECETAMIRVQGTKDYVGPDCRYLKFKMGEEIIVYSKLSRKREDLWAGSKGKDFGYFPKNAVQIEDVFITEEVEVPTKETDFLCLDGGEYLLENKDSVLHDHNEESEYPLPYTEPESKMPEGELQKQTSISFHREHGIESVPESDELDRKFKDPHTQKETEGNKLFRKNKNGKDDAVLQEAESSHPLKPAPIQSTWTVSGVVGWLGLGSKQDEEAFETVTESLEENTFRSRKIAITDESDMKELNDEDKPDPSGWFQSRLTDLLRFGRENSGLGLLSKENNPQIHDSSSNAEHSEFEQRNAAAETSTEEKQKSDNEVSKSSWFNLGLSDVLTFGHAKKENTITKEEQSREMKVATDKNEEIQTSSPQETESQMDRELKKATAEVMISEEQNNKKNNVQEILDSDNKTPTSGEPSVNEDNPLNLKSIKNAEESSFTTDVADKDKLIEPYSLEQDPVSETQVMENTEVKEITQESESINGQSGWYENIYSNFITFNRDTSDNQQGQKSVVAHGTQESVTSQLHSFPSSPQSLDSTIAKNSEEEKHETFEESRSFLSLSHFTNILHFHSLTTKVKESVQSAQEDLNFSEELSQFENNDEILQGSKETAVKLQANQRVSENVQETGDVAMSQESVLLSPLAVQSNEQSSEKTIQDTGLVKDNNTSPLLSVESQLEPKISPGQHSQISRYSNPEEPISDGSERQEFSNIKDNSDVPISKDQQHVSLDLKLENTIDSPVQHEYLSEDFYSSEQRVLSKEEPIEHKENRTDKNEEMHGLNLQETETYIERKSKREIAEMMQDEGQNNLKTNKQESVDSEYDTPSSGELPANLDSLLNFKKNLNEAESPLTQGISDKTKLTELYSTEQNSAAESQIIENTEVKEITEESESKNDQAGWYEYISGNIDFNMDISDDQKEQESIVSQDTQESVVSQLLSSSSLSQDLDITDNSEKDKQNQFEEPQSVFSFSRYKNILSFQCFATKDEHSLQRLPETLSFDDENGQTTNGKEIELKGQTNQKINEQVLEKSDVDISKESVLFSPLTVQNIEQDSENTMKDTKLVKDSSLLSFTESQLEHRVDPLFTYPKCKEHNSKSNEREEFSNIKEKSEGSILEDEQQVSLESKLNIKDLPGQHGYFCEDSYSSQQNINKKGERQGYLAENFSEDNGHELGIDNSADTKKVQVSDQLSSLEFDESLSKHHGNNEVQGQHITLDSEEERELTDVEYTENSSDKGLHDVSQDSIKDNFSNSNVDDVVLDKIVVNSKDINNFSQDRIKQPENFSQHISKCGEDNLEHSEQMIKNYEPNKPQNEKRANILANQESSSVDTSEEIIQSENIILEQDSHTLNYLLDGLQNKGNEVPQSSVPFPQEQIDEDYNKREHISNPFEHHSDNTRISDDSLTVNVLGEQVLKEQIIAPDASADTFSEEELQSQQISMNIPRHKKEPIDIELDDSSSQHEPLISEHGTEDNTNSDPGKNCKNQMLHNKRKESSILSDLEVPEPSSSSHHEDTESINTENESEYQKISSYPHSNDNVKPKLQDVAESQKMSEESLVTTKTTAESNHILLTEHEHLFQGQSSVVENSEKRKLALHLESFESTELQTQAPLKNHGGCNPNKPLSHIPHYHDSAHNNIERVPSQSEQGLDTLHLNAVKHRDLNGKRHIDREDALPTENINNIEKLTLSEKARDSKEKSKKDTDDQKKTDSQNINNKNGVMTEGVVTSIFTKTSQFLGSLFSKNNNGDLRKNSEHKIPVLDPNENREDIRINQIKVEFNNVQRREAELKENESEQEKVTVQTAEATNNLNIDNFKMLKNRSEEGQLGIQEKKITSETGTNNKETDKTIIWETESMSQKTRKEGQSVIERNTDISKPFIAYQLLYSKLSQEVKQPLKSLCEKNKLLVLEQQFKKVQHDITTFTCEDSFMQKKQVTASVEEEHNLDIGYEKCIKEKMNFLPELQDLLSAIRTKCEAQNAESDISDERKLSDKAPKEDHHRHTVLYKERNSGQHSKAITIAPVNAQKKMYNSAKNVQLDAKKPLSQIFFLIQNYIPNNEEDWIYQILLHFDGLDVGDLVKSVFSAMATVSKKVVAVLPEDMRPGPDLYGFPWEIVICAAVVGVFTVLLFLGRSYQSVRSRLYIGREKQLASKVAELLKEKCEVLEKLSLHKKEYEDLESSLKDASLLKESSNTSHIEATCEKLNRSNTALKDEIENLEKELEEEKSKRSEQDDLMAEIQRRMESLENEAKSIQSQVAEAKTTLKVFHINKERLETSVQDAVQENCHLQESEKQLLQEAEGWGERFSELNEQTKMFESSKADMEEALKNKESQVKSLTECLLKMKDWSIAIGEDNTEDNHWDVDITENGELLDDQQKRTIKKLIYAAKLNACLKTLEAERNQVYLKLADEDKAKEELKQRIENLQSEQVSLHSENAHFESELQKLQQKLKVMTELYQENEMKLHRKLTVEERERLQKEEKLSKVDEKINHAAEELNIYRQRAKDLEEELDRTIHSYQSQINSHEKKAHDNWLTSRAAERHLNDLRKENAHNRQKLTEMEFRFDLLEKDPHALDVPVRPFGREHSPYGPSPMGRPSSETRAFLSPPTLLEGPLRLSPMLPGGGGRGSRGAGNPAMYEAANERGELSSDRLSDPHRAPSDTGSLSPPWDRDHRIMLPSSGRLSGPAELRSYNMQSFDKAGPTDSVTAVSAPHSCKSGLGCFKSNIQKMRNALGMLMLQLGMSLSAQVQTCDGQASPENSLRTEPSGNGTKDHPSFSNFLNVSDQSLASESEAIGSGFAPPPLPPVRAPLLPVDPRGAFIRRGPPFPPPPPIGMYGPREYFPRDFAGLQHPSGAMRNPFPLRPFSQYPPQRAGSFPPPLPSLENRSEPPGLIHQSNTPATGHPEPQQDT